MTVFLQIDVSGVRLVCCSPSFSLSSSCSSSFDKHLLLSSQRSLPAVSDGLTWTLPNCPWLEWAVPGFRVSSALSPLYGPIHKLQYFECYAITVWFTLSGNYCFCVTLFILTWKKCIFNGDLTSAVSPTNHVSMWRQRFVAVSSYTVHRNHCLTQFYL